MTAEQLIAALEAMDGARYVLDQAIAKLVLPADILARVVPPPYTVSIDAALTLVPEGWRWSLIDAAPPLSGLRQGRSLRAGQRHQAA